MSRVGPIRSGGGPTPCASRVSSLHRLIEDGAALPEPSGILEGQGSTSRSLKMLDGDDPTAKTLALQGLVRSWIELRAKARGVDAS